MAEACEKWDIAYLERSVLASANPDEVFPVYVSDTNTRVFRYCDRRGAPDCYVAECRPMTFSKFCQHKLACAEGQVLLIHLETSARNRSMVLG